MLGKPHQVRLFLSLLGKREAFTVPELAEECGLQCSVVYPFIAYLRRLGVVFPLPRPEEPGEWGEIYGRVVLQRKRRELHIIGSAPFALNRGRLRSLAAEKCGDSEVLGFIGEASR
jgi:hypothetical protein